MVTRESRGGVVRRVLAGSLLVGAAVLGSATPASADWLDNEDRLTTGEGTRQWPQVSGARVVYATDASATSAARTGFDIRVQDLGTGEDRLLTPDGGASGAPAISGDRVVWPQAGADAGIWYANLATGEHRRLDTFAGEDVAISGTRVCFTWTGRVRVFDLASGAESAVSPQGADAGHCDLSGSTVVWQDDRGGDPDVYALDLATGAESRLTSDSAAQTLPRVDGRIVVWQDARSSTTAVHTYDLASRTETTLTAPGAQSAPDVSDGRVVWTDERHGHGNAEVYLFDLAAGVEVRVTHDDGWSGNASLSGDRVVYEDVRPAGQQLYLRSITPPRLPVTVDRTGPQPLVTGRLVGTGGAPVVAATVRLEVSADARTWHDADAVAVATTAGDGSFEFTVPEVSGAGWLRVRFAGRQEIAPAVSASVRAVG
jgi:beta propeller repeat protein